MIENSLTDSQLARRQGTRHLEQETAEDRRGREDRSAFASLSANKHTNITMLYFTSK